MSTGAPPAPPATHTPSEFSLARFEAFSDGVFAIAITLLVIEIHVPELHGLSHIKAVMKIGELWPQFLSFAASFVVISIACDYRYLYFTDIAALTGLIYLAVDPQGLLGGARSGRRAM